MVVTVRKANSKPELSQLLFISIKQRELIRVLAVLGLSTYTTFSWSVMNIEWDYSYYQPWSDNEWLVDEMMVLVTNFIWPYLHQFFDDSHGLKASLKPLKRPFDKYQSHLKAINNGRDIRQINQ